MSSYAVVAEITVPTASHEVVCAAAEEALAHWAAVAVVTAQTGRGATVEIAVEIEAPDMDRAVDDANEAIWTQLGHVWDAYRAVELTRPRAAVPAVVI